MSNTSLLGSYGGQAGDGLFFRNRILNGCMRIDQRNAGANVSLGGNTELHITDRFPVARNGGTATLSVIRQVTTISGATNFEANSAPAGFTHALKVQIGTAQAVGTTFETEIKHSLEGFNGADWGWGTADAKPVVLSFWVKSSLTGNFGVGMRSATFNYSIVTSYTINAANTWEYKTITITPPTSGTFYQDTRLHHTLYWDLGVGSTFSTSSLNTWQAADFRGGLTGGVKLAETAGANFYITGVQLEAGPTATPFERRPYSVELGMCEHYYQVVELSGGPVNLYPTTGTGYFQVPYKTMRTISSVVFDTSINNGGFIYFNAVSVACAYSINAPASRNSISAKIDRISGIFGAGEVCGHTYIRLKLSAEL